MEVPNSQVRDYITPIFYQEKYSADGISFDLKILDFKDCPKDVDPTLSYQCFEFTEAEFGKSIGP